MRDRPFVTEDEILVVLCCDESGDVCVGPIEQAEDVLAFLEGDSSVQQLVRLNLKTLNAEDVSEQLADLYIENLVLFEEDDPFPPYILESDAYHVYRDQKIARDYEDSLYGSYEQQHRLRPCDVLTDSWG